MSQRFIFMHLLVIGPCIALFTGRWQATAAVGLAALIVGNLLAASDGVRDTFADLSGLITIAVVSLTAARAAALIHRSRSQKPLAHVAPSTS